MSKQRFRDLKQGRVTKQKSKVSKNQNIQIAKRMDYIKAFLTDSFMLLMPIMYIVFYAIFGGREGFAEHKLLGWLYILVPLAIIESIFIIRSASGQTPGMKAYNLKLIFLPTGQKPPATTVFLRQLLSKITFLIFGWIILFFRKDSRNLHDLIAGTALVYDDTKK